MAITTSSLSCMCFRMMESWMLAMTLKDLLSFMLDPFKDDNLPGKRPFPFQTPPCC